MNTIKSKLFFTVMLCGITAFHATAQTNAYYHKRYALSVRDIASASSSLGSSLVVTGSGAHNLPAVPKDLISLIRTDGLGSIAPTANTFSNIYELKNGNVSLQSFSSGVASPGTTAATPTNVITVGGNFLTSVNTPQSTFILTVNGDGTTRSARQLTPQFATNEVKITAVESKALTINNVFGTAMVFLAGYIDISSIAPGSEKASFVMAINSNTNTIVWSKIYDLTTFGITGEREEVADIMVSDNQLVVTGNATVAQNSNLLPNRGFVFRLDPATGNLIGDPFIVTFQRPTKINSISPTNTFSQQLHQIHLCGETEDILINNGKAKDTWVATLNTVTPSVVWSKQYDYSNLGDNNGSDVNNFGGRLLVTGTAQNGTAGGDADMTVLRLDVADGTVDFEATYGVPGIDRGFSAQHHFGNTGFRAIGQQNILANTPAFYVVSAYYNGVSGCNEVLTSVSPVNLTAKTKLTTMDIIPFNQNVVTLTVVRTAVGTTSTTCFFNSIPEGDNTNQAQFEEPVVTEVTNAEPSLTAYPNPVSAQEAMQINYTTSGTMPVQLQIYDATGREVSSRQETPQPGMNQFMISPGDLAPGSYLLLIREGDHVTKQKLLVY